MLSFLFHGTTLTVVDVRESFNAAVFGTAPVMGFLLARFLWLQVCRANESYEATIGPLDRSAFRRVRFVYTGLDWTVKAAVGWILVCIAESFRSVIVWYILHFERNNPTYLLHIIPLTIALGVIVTGMLCTIRHITPEHWGRHSVWVPTLIVTVLLILFAS